MAARTTPDRPAALTRPQLMIDHGAGVSDEEVIRIRRIDSDYFTDD